MDDSLENGARTLKYGATVFLCPQHNIDEFLYSDGFVKTTLSLRNCQKSSSRSYFDRCLFKIYPSFNNTVKKEVLSFPEKIAKESISGVRKLELAEELKDRLSMEIKLNLDVFEKALGQPISYEQPVQFLHVASNKFLSLVNKEADIERENLKLELVEQPSEWTIFKIGPSFKHQKASEGIIYLNDFVYIKSVQTFLKMQPHVHSTTVIQEEDEANLKLIKPIPTIKYHRTPSFQFNTQPGQQTHSQYLPSEVEASVSQNAPNEKHIEKNILSKKEVNASIEELTRWQIQGFNEPLNDLNYLAYGDVVWINNSEFNSTLIARAETSENFLVEFIEAMQTDQFQHYVGHTNGMWVLEHRVFYAGGYVTWDQCFRLRNLTSGLYLTARKDSPHRYSLVMEPSENDWSLWKFVPAPSAHSNHYNSKSAGLIPKDAFVLIQNYCSEKWLKMITEKGSHDDRHHPQTTMLSNATLSGKCDAQDTCKISRANMNEIWETNFLISCFPRLKKYLKLVKVWRGVRYYYLLYFL
mgnify:FL=1